MTYEDVESGIKDLISKPETATANGLKLLEAIKSDYDAMSSLITEREQMQTKIKDLQDTNIKLFLSQTSSVDDQNDKTEEEQADEILNKLSQEE